MVAHKVDRLYQSLYYHLLPLRAPLIQLQLEAESGATALTLGDGSYQETLDLISNGIKKFGLILSNDVKQMTLSLASIAGRSPGREGCGRILALAAVVLLTFTSRTGSILTDCNRSSALVPRL